MYINNYLNSSMRMLSNRSIAQSSHAKSYSKTENLDFKSLITKSKSKTSDEELKKAIKEQAKLDAATGIYGSKEFKKIEESYISVVSPDRKGIIGHLMNTIFKTRIPSYAEVKHPSGSALSGSVIATYSQFRGWDEIGTKEEFARSSEINLIYNDAWKAAYHGDNKDTNQLIDSNVISVISVNSIYNKTV